MLRVLHGLLRAATRVLEAADDALVDFGNPPPKTPKPPELVLPHRRLT